MEEFAGVFDSGVNTNDGPHMAVCQFVTTLKPEIVDRILDSRAVNSTQPESSTPTIDPNVSKMNWEDGVWRLLICADDFPQGVLQINSRNPEAADMQHGADEISTGRMATRTGCWLDVEDYSDTDSIAELEYKTWDEARAWEFRNARGDTNVNLSHNSRMDMNREYVSDVDTDTDSDTELDYTVTNCALWTCKCCCAPADVPPVDVLPEDFKPVWNSDADTEECNHGEWIIRNKQSPWIFANHQHGWENSDRQTHDSMDITEWYPITTDCLQQEEGDWAPANCPPADVPPGVIQQAASKMTLSNMKIDDNPEKCEQDEWMNRKLHSPWVCVIHRYGRKNSNMRKYDSRDIAECSPNTSDYL